MSHGDRGREIWNSRGGSHPACRPRNHACFHRSCVALWRALSLELAEDGLFLASMNLAAILPWCRE